MENIRLSIATLLLAILAFFLVSWFFPGYWNWSVFDFQGISPFNFIIALIIALLLILTKLSHLLYSHLSNLLVSLNSQSSRLPSPLRLILWIIIPGLILFGLKSNCHILGDGNLILSHIVNDNLISSTAIGVSLLVKFLYATLNGIAGIGPATLMQSISIVCGIVFLYFLYRILKILIADMKSRLAIYSVLCTAAVIVLFTGYVETYPVLIAWLALYLYFALRYIKNGQRFCITLILFFIGVFWHIWFMAFFPSLLFILNLRFNKLSSKLLLLFSGLYVAGIYLGGLFIKRTGIPLVLPILPSDNSQYILFSPTHLMDFFNQLVIIGPVMALLTLLLLVIKGKGKSGKAINFLSYAAFPAMLIAFMIDPALGAIRDWDLMSIFALPLFLIGATLFANLIKTYAKLQYLVVPILLTGILHTSGFLLNNKAPDIAVSRVVEILLIDPHYQLNYYQGKRITPFSTILSNVYDRYEDGTLFMEKIAEEDKADYTDYLNLANQYYNAEDFEKAQHYYDLIPNDLLPKLEYYFAYGESLYRTKQYTRAVEQLRIVLKDSSFAKLYYILGSAYLGESQPDSAQKYYDLAYESQVDTISFLQNTSHNFSYFKFHDYAIKYYQTLYQLNPDLENLKNEIATTYHSLRQPDSAHKYYSLVLEEDPESYNTLINMAQLYIEADDFSTALSVLDLVDRLYPHDVLILSKIGFTLQNLSRHEEAIEICKTALAIKPNNTQVRHLIATEYFVLDSLDHALENWKSLLVLDSGFVPAYYCLARCYDKMEEGLMAEKYLLSWLRLNPSGRTNREAQLLLKRYKLLN